MVWDRELFREHPLGVRLDGAELDGETLAGQDENAIVIRFESAARQDDRLAGRHGDRFDLDLRLASARVGHDRRDGADRQGESECGRESN